MQQPQQSNWGTYPQQAPRKANGFINYALPFAIRMIQAGQNGLGILPSAAHAAAGAFSDYAANKSKELSDWQAHQNANIYHDATGNNLPGGAYTGDIGKLIDTYGNADTGAFIGRQVGSGGSTGDWGQNPAWSIQNNVNGTTGFTTGAKETHTMPAYEQAGRNPVLDGKVMGSTFGPLFVERAKNQQANDIRTENARAAKGMLKYFNPKIQDEQLSFLDSLSDEALREILNSGYDLQQQQMIGQQQLANERLKGRYAVQVAGTPHRSYSYSNNVSHSTSHTTTTTTNPSFEQYIAGEIRAGRMTAAQGAAYILSAKPNSSTSADGPLGLRKLQKPTGGNTNVDPIREDKEDKKAPQGDWSYLWGGKN